MEMVCESAQDEANSPNSQMPCPFATDIRLTYTPGQKFCPLIGEAITSPNSAIRTFHYLFVPLQSLKMILSALQCALYRGIL